jgi:general secretion pathway protein N
MSAFLKPVWWLAILLLAVLFWAAWLVPAKLVLERLDGIVLGPAELQLSRVDGRLWQGGARWQWQQLSGGLRWQTDWRGLTPGVALNVTGDIVASGWLGSTGGGIDARSIDLALPLAPFVRDLPNITADGAISVRGLSLQWSEAGPRAAEGSLAYNGGDVSWAAGQGATLPPLQGTLLQDGEAALAQVYSPEGTLLADARLDKEYAQLRVYRAWPALLGASQGGNLADVVFETSQQLTAQ